MTVEACGCHPSLAPSEERFSNGLLSWMFMGRGHTHQNSEYAFLWWAAAPDWSGVQEGPPIVLKVRLNSPTQESLFGMRTSRSVTPWLSTWLATRRRRCMLTVDLSHTPNVMASLHHPFKQKQR